MNSKRLKILGYFNLTFTILMATGLFVSLFPVFHKISIRWSGGDNSYCYLVIPLFLYLLWDRRNREAQSSRLKAKGDENGRFEEQKLGGSESGQVDGFRFGEFSWNNLGLIPIILSIGLILIGEFGSVETLMYIGIWGCLVGITFLLYGWRIRYLIFPLIILAFIVPLPPFINQMLTFQLKLAASSLATFMLRISGISVFQEGNIIDLGITQLQVVDACSGLRYLIPLLLLALLIGYFFSKRLWRRVVLLFCVLPISVFLNAFRIWITGILTIKGHAELAENLFHDFTGWLVFMIAGGILFGITRILNAINRRHAQTYADNLSEETAADFLGQGGESTESTHNAASNELQGSEGTERQVTKSLTKPVVLTILVCLVFITSGYALKKIPSASNLPQREAFKSFPMQIGKWQGKRSYIEKRILAELWADDYVQAAYINSETRNVIHVLIPFYEYQGTRHTAHAPQSCLLGGGWALTGSKERTVKMDGGQQITLMTMNLEKGDAKILGSYFFFMRGRVLTSPWLNKFYLMWDSFTKQRTDGALVRAELVVAPGQTMDEAWNELEGFIAEMWKVLPAYVPN